MLGISLSKPVKPLASLASVSILTFGGLQSQAVADSLRVLLGASGSALTTKKQRFNFFSTAATSNILVANLGVNVSELMHGRFAPSGSMIGAKCPRTSAAVGRIMQAFAATVPAFENQVGIEIVLHKYGYPILPFFNHDFAPTRQFYFAVRLSNLSVDNVLYTISTSTEPCCSVWHSGLVEGSAEGTVNATVGPFHHATIVDNNGTSVLPSGHISKGVSVACMPGHIHAHPQPVAQLDWRIIVPCKAADVTNDDHILLVVAHCLDGARPVLSHKSLTVALKRKFGNLLRATLVAKPSDGEADCPDDEVDACFSVSTLHPSSQVSTTPFQSLGTGMGLSTSSTTSGSSLLGGTMSVAPLVFDLEEELFNLGTPKRACAYTPPCTPESSKKAKTAGQDY